MLSLSYYLAALCANVYQKRKYTRKGWWELELGPEPQNIHSQKSYLKRYKRNYFQLCVRDLNDYLIWVACRPFKPFITKLYATRLANHETVLLANHDRFRRDKPTGIVLKNSRQWNVSKSEYFNYFTLLSVLTLTKYFCKDRYKVKYFPSYIKQINLKL